MRQHRSWRGGGLNAGASDNAVEAVSNLDRDGATVEPYDEAQPHGYGQLWRRKGTRLLWVTTAPCKEATNRLQYRQRQAHFSTVSS